MDATIGDLLDTAPCGFVSFGDDSRILHINTTLLQRLDYERGALIGQPLDRILTVGSRIFHQTHFFPLVKLHGRAQEVFILFRARDGSDIGMLCNARRRERSGVQVTDCVLMEVQERRKFEDALVVARQAADEANKAKSTFLAVMSHELRTPLNAIGGYVQLIEMGVHGPVTDAQREALGRIDRSQRHLLRLINDVLNLARIEAGRVDYAVERVRLSDVIGNVLPMVEPQMVSKEMHYECDVPVNLEAKADREKVQQILINLLTNAVKFTARGGRLRVEGGEFSTTQLFLRVTDTGIGIAPEMLERVFEPFVQVDDSRSRFGEGTGLGLAISRDLARGMGGDLTAQSAIGKGSTFGLTLPRFGNGVGSP